MSKRWTLADVSMVVLAAKILTGRDVSSMSSTYGGTRIFADAEQVRQVESETGAAITLEHRKGSYDYPWEAQVRYGGVTFFCLLKPEQLPLVGFSVLDVSALVPVAIGKEVQAG